MVSAVPVRPTVLPPLLLQGKPTQAQRVAEPSNQLLDDQTLSPLSPNTEQPQQAGVTQQQQQQGSSSSRGSPGSRVPRFSPSSCFQHNTTPGLH
ncbi:hypothetical protein F7725_005411 [Dissostichus mawsoni]|uniref:Uncharacterized protein n=1 Tax=Dissostichus mawsoni TaxID=36200 RepID=A0A7J5YRA8_DISMA|nr:hypothetical protein F7725_005411 [Dissostichus mawsoni]